MAMANDRQNPLDNNTQNNPAQQKNTEGEHHINPFKDKLDTAEERTAAQEEADKEQQLKDAMTERD